MTTNNDWPGKPGVPMNPEQDGWHWFVRGDFYSAALWHRGHFSFLDTTIRPEEFSQLDIIYAGPVLPPDEAAALQKRCEEAERERDALRRDASQEITTDELARRLQHLGDWQAADRIEALQKRVAELEGALKDAAASVKEWGASASQYLQDKRDLSGEVARYIAIAEGKNAAAKEGKR